MIEIRFFVPGIPQSAGSKSAFAIKKAGTYTGQVAVTEAGTKDSRQRKRDWRAKVSSCAMAAIAKAQSIPKIAFPLPGAFEIEFLFQMPRPKSHYRSNGVELRPGASRFHVSMPDAGKLARGTQDALKGIVFRDDSQVVKETHEKTYSDQPGAWIVAKYLE